MTDAERDFYKKREAQERALAAACSTSTTRAVHLGIAAEYAVLLRIDPQTRSRS
jgi:hypothetical protein